MLAHLVSLAAFTSQMNIQGFCSLSNKTHQWETGVTGVVLSFLLPFFLFIQLI
jgi:hypothetical protein